MKINKEYLHLLIIIIGTIIRCFIAANVELGNDEVYYWTYALHLQTSYFDHPPLVALFIRLFTFNLNLTGNICKAYSDYGSAINTWLIYRVLCKIKNRQAGIYAALVIQWLVFIQVL